MIYGALIIPLLAALFLCIFKREQVTVKEYIALTICGTIAVLIGNYTAKYSATSDVKYVSGFVTVTEYHESWNEKVGCRHNRYTYTTDSKGHTHSHYAGKMHSYDVDDHPTKWTLIDSLGNNRDISEGYYHSLVSKWGVEPCFVNMNRNYYTKNGNKYTAVWTNDDSTMEVVSTETSYENRAQAAPDFKFKTIDNPIEIGLYDYPEPQNYVMPSILGSAGPDTTSADKILSIANARLSARKDARIWLLIFKNKEEKIARLQEQYWKKGNDNEFVACLGVNEKNCAEWVYCFSWTKKESLKQDVCRFVSDYISHNAETSEVKPINLVEVAGYLKESVERQWEKRDFNEFKELDVLPTAWGIAGAYLFTIIACALISFYVSKN